MQQDIEHIIYDGTLAPSGENCQPWKFVVTGNKISIYNIPESDKSIYNFKQKGSYVSHGAVIENILISAANYGYSIDVDIFPKKEEPNLVSIITLKKSEAGKDPLYEYLGARCTNRKSHANQKLSDEQKNILVNVAKDSGFGELNIIDDQERMKTLGAALAVNEQIIFENKELHQFFYDHILWNSEDQKKAGGFYIKTLEFLPHQLKGVKLLRNWTILTLLNRLAKISHTIVKENAEKYSASGALAIISMSGSSDKDFVNAGRAMEQVWLNATKMGISVHPCTGVLYLVKNIHEGNEKIFSTEHQKIIKDAYESILQTFGVKNKAVPALFRLGFSDEPSSRALRLEPKIIYLQ